MKNLDEFEKSKGVVILAKKTDKIDYVEIANRSQRFIESKLNLPVSIFEPSETKSTSNKTGKESTEWRNFFRWQVYKKSPYDTTIILDADYITLTDNLLKFTTDKFDYRILRTMITPEGAMESFMGYRLRRHLWATVIVFQKTPKTKLLFELVKRVENNWNYYSKLFKLDHQSFRNDFAFTIADLVMNGYQCGQHNLPHSLLTIVDPIKQIQPVNGFLNIKTENKNLVITHQDLHIMDKTYLLSDDFLRFEESVLG